MTTQDTRSPGKKKFAAPADRAEAILEHLITKKGGSRRDGQVEMARHVADALSTSKPGLIQGGTGIGKALDIDTLIPCVEGFIRMGDIQAGVHHPFGPDGKPCNITEAFDVLHGRTCYEIGFNGGGRLVADAEHQWDTITDSASLRQTSKDPWEGAVTRTTEELKDTLRTRNRPNHRIPMAKPTVARKTSIPVGAYELGFWLGASQRRSLDTGITTVGVTPEELEGFDLAPRGTKVSVIPTDATRKKLDKLGLLTEDRFIPEKYLFASEAQRRALLAGLMDAMGQPSRSQRQTIAQVTAYKSQHKLIEDVHALACSLGLRASLGARNIQTAAAKVPTNYRTVYFTPNQQVFRNEQKAEALGEFGTDARHLVSYRSIMSITEVESRPVRCISVDSPRNLYLAGRDFIPTHNSLAYLAGALATGLTTGVAPHTKALQDQLANDLDLVASAFGDADFEDPETPLDHQPTYAIIKGRSSYFCHNKASGGSANTEDQAMLGEELEPIKPSTDLGKEIVALMEWAKTTETGDRSDAPPVSSRAWENVAGSNEDCSANGCKRNPSLCFAEQAHENAKGVDIVIVNQAYLAMAMKIENMGLDVSCVIVDEAHELSGTISGVFGAVVKRKRVENAVKRASNLLQGNNTFTEQDAERLQKDSDRQLNDLERALKDTDRFSADREIVQRPVVVKAIEDLALTMGPVMEKLKGASSKASDDKVKATIKVTHQTLENLVEDLNLIAAGSDDFQVAWASLEYGLPVLHSAQFDVSETIHEQLIERITGGSVVMTSATLTVGGKFDHPAQQMGFEIDPETYPWTGHVVSSPFNYEEQGVIWLPENMPAPINTKEGKDIYSKAVADVAIKTARAAGGRTLVLCTSKQSVETVSERLKEKLAEDVIPVLVQESGAPIQGLAKAFGENPRAVLVGTRTFWTGVSVEGDTCVAVVVDKIPFPRPDDPIVAARVEKVDRNEGRGKGFQKVSLAEAVLTIVQGVGRLIRTVDDRGVVVICDPRVNPRSEHKKGYWRSIANSLPPFSRTTSEERALAFLREIDRTAAEGGSEAEVDEGADDVADVEKALAS